MKRYFVLTIGAVAALAGCNHNKPQVQAGGQVIPMVTPATASVLPVGTTMTAQLNQEVGPSVSREGDRFTATVTHAVIAQNGATAVPVGAMLFGRVTGLHGATMPTDQAVIRLDFDSIAFNGRAHPFDGNISNVSVRESNRSTRTNAVRGAVTGGAAGAVFGAIVSGGDLNRVISSGILGAAAGTVISLGVGSTTTVIPAGTAMTVTSTQEVRVR